MSTSVSPDPSGKLSRFAARYPYIFVLLLLAIFALAVVVFPLLTRYLNISSILRTYGAEGSGVLLAILLLSFLHWWRATGFLRGLTSQGLLLYIVPIVLICVPSLLVPLLLLAVGSIHATPLLVIRIAALVLLIGFAEETFFRGLILRTLLSRGVLLSAILSSTLFMLAHLVNLFGSFPPPYVAGQLILAFGMGFFLAALWLRTGSIWPLIFLHAIRDFGGLLLISTNPKLLSSINYQSSIMSSSVLSILFLAYAIFLLRPSQLRILRAYYTPHLFPQSPLIRAEAMAAWSPHDEEEQHSSNHNDPIPPHSQPL